MAIRHKRTATSGYNWQASDLVEGQIGLNLADGTLHFKITGNTVATLSEVPGNISAFTNDSGYLTSYTETDPVFAASAAAGITSGNITTWDTALQPGANISELTNDAGYLTGYTETDPVFSASAAAAITSGNISTWNSAVQPNANISVFTNDAGYITSVTTALGYTPENAANRGQANGYASLDASGLVPSSQLPSFVDDVLEYANFAAFPVTGETGKIYVAIDTSTTYRWSGSAYVEITGSPGSTDAVPEGSTNLYFTAARVRSNISVSGNLSYDSGTGVISYTTPANVSAFTNDAGYLTGYTETDPVFSASAAAGITSGNISNWNTAYGWGNHATQGYLTSYTETDPVFAASAAAGITSGNISNWNTAYGWGNHATQGYLTTANLNTLTDVTITAPANAQVLAYDSASSKWINSNATSGSSSLSSLTDVSIDALGDRQILEWDTTTNKWINVSAVWKSETVNVSDNSSTDASYYVILSSGTGYQTMRSDSALRYNPSTNTLTVGNISNATISGGTITGANIVNALDTVYDLGTTSGTIAPNAANGSVQRITLNGTLTLNAFTSPVAGQTITLIVTQDSTGSRTLSSTMKFANGGYRILSTAAGATDIINIFYDGTNYWAGLSKGFI